MEYTKIEIFKKYKIILIKNSIMVFILFSLTFISIYSVLEYNNIKTNRLILENSEINIVNTERAILNRYFNTVVSDVEYISKDFSIHEKTVDESSNEEVEKEWLLFSKTKGIYDQIRFLDKDGYEVIRVNNNNGEPSLVSKKELQNKKDRYYFKDSLDLQNGQIYISKFDLNVENNIIEIPMKPVIRFSTPIYDDNSKFKGVIVLNYLAYSLIDDFKRISDNGKGDIFLLNPESYYLINEDNRKEWAFMYDDKKNNNFKKDFKNEWNKINESEEGQFITKNGLFTFSTIVPIRRASNKIKFNEEGYKIVSHVPLNDSTGYYYRNKATIIADSLYEKIYIFIIIGFMSSIIAALTAINKASKDKIKYFADFDTMTGVLNRRAGLGKLEELFNKSKEYKTQISICFIDINGLKDVNDTLGHDLGDELIKTSVGILKKNTRNEDFIIRLGGDEFLIVFPNAESKAAEKVWERVVEEFEKINNEENREYIISISHGIAEYKPHTKNYLDDLISQADKKMYEEKREIKKDIKIIKDKNM